LRILHGSWLTNFADDVRAFALWAETHETRPAVRAPQHPFAASTSDLRAVLKQAAAAG
jgi:hypothetical protein